MTTKRSNEEDTMATRTIEQVLALRLRAAQLRVLERTTALVKQQEAVQASLTHERDVDEHSKLLDAKILADDAVRAAQREIEAQQTGAELASYEPPSHFALRRYAAVLMADDPGMDAEEALAQAKADDRVLFENHMTRAYGPNWNTESATDEETTR